MNFDRNRAQSMCEELVGCYDLNTWSNYKNAFESIELSFGDAMTLKTNLFQDANDYYFKGVLSLFEGINGLTRNLSLGQL